jgi:hypothetical protein
MEDEQKINVKVKERFSDKVKKFFGIK